VVLEEIFIALVTKMLYEEVFYERQRVKRSVVLDSKTASLN
jgi:hypothetical protein